MNEDVCEVLYLIFPVEQLILVSVCPVGVPGEEGDGARCRPAVRHESSEKGHPERYLSQEPERGWGTALYPGVPSSPWQPPTSANYYLLI